MAEPTLYLFDGFNLLHAGGFESTNELRDLLAGWVATKGARGVLVFDGHGDDERHGPLEVRFAPDADALIERLAAEHRQGEQKSLGEAHAYGRGGAEDDEHRGGSERLSRRQVERDDLDQSHRREGGGEHGVAVPADEHFELRAHPAHATRPFRRCHRPWELCARGGNGSSELCHSLPGGDAVSAARS